MSLSKFFKALNDPTRREILNILRKSDLKAGEIVSHFNISGASISHHLEILKNAALISSERKGQFIVYSLNTTVVDEIINWMVEFKNKPKNEN
jgi:DNA-binding transcriptional ArsR family regulator